MKVNSQRIAAFNILRQFELTKMRLDIIEEKELSKLSLTTHQHRHVKNLTSGVLRNLKLLDFYTQQLYKGNFLKLLDNVKIILRMAFYELKFMPHIPGPATVNEYVNMTRQRVNEHTSKMTNAILRNFLRLKTELLPDAEKNPIKKLGIQYSFPEWLLERWVADWGVPFTEKLCASINHLPEFDVRVNGTKITSEEFEVMLSEDDIAYEKSARFRDIYKIKKVSAILEKGYFEKGLCSIQDESAAIPASLFTFNQNDIFLDLCAAPGGKFTQVLETAVALKMAVAVDISVDRLKRIRQNLQRLQLKGYLVAADARFLPFKIQFTKILIDAPCSGQGVVSKHPDIKWRRTPEEIDEFSLLQKSILENASQFLCKNGQLVYSTCSIDRRENEAVIDDILDQPHNSLRKIMLTGKDEISDTLQNGYIRTFPHLHTMDGSFASLLSTK
ncbi:MAG: 16S rRNA (cytosine(967)-C(5))-methyltransferase RsmB [Calditrichae bacterium]|nr:16S rRNA (cytosine(967)-C(5))-methyltransferase RsmB [Calditrichia bacterium]